VRYEKTAPARVKTVAQDADLGEGEFEAIVSVFSTVDSVGDIVMPGAFAKTLAAYGEKNAPVPVVWSHDWADPFSHIGYSLSAEETDAGLKVRGKLDIDNNPKAMQVYRLLKGGRIRDFSFAYEIKDGGFRKAEGDDSPDGLDADTPYELRELDLFEVGPCLVGAHRDTELLAIKNARGNNTPTPASVVITTNIGDVPAVTDLRTGKAVVPEATPDEPAATTAPDVETIISKFTQDLLVALRQRNGKISNDDPQAMPDQPATTDDPPAGVKVDEPARTGAASDRLRTDLRLLIAEVDSIAD